MILEYHLQETEYSVQIGRRQAISARCPYPIFPLYALSAAIVRANMILIWMGKIGQQYSFTIFLKKVLLSNRKQHR